MHTGYQKTRKLGLMALEKRLMLDASLPALAGQVLWLDAADTSTVRDAEGDAAGTGGFSGAVTTWMDKSGSGFHVSSIPSQTPDYGLNTLNGHGLITFNGTSDSLINSGATIAGNDYTMFIVFNRTTAAARDAVFELGNGGSRNGVFINEGGNNRISHYSNGTFAALSSPYVASTYTMLSVIHDGTSINAWNGAGNQLNTVTSARVSTTGIFVGDDSTSGDQLQGNIAEIIVYDRDLTALERHDVENYLASKWGLAETNTAPVVATNTGATLNQGAQINVTGAMLSSTDSDNTASGLIYTLTDIADYGILTNTNTSLNIGLGDTFTQADINSGYIIYSHDNSFNFSDAFSFTVTDQYSTTAASTFNLTMNPTNQAPVIQGWTQVSFENFEAGATGWSDNTTETSNPYFTSFLGRHSLEGGLQNTSKTYALSGTQDYIVVTFDMYEIDSWDGEAFRIFVDDAMIYSYNFSQGVFNIPSDGGVGIISWTVQEMTPFNANFTYGGWAEQIYRYTLTIATPAASVKLGFSSTLDQAAADEAWGVDNIAIYEVQDGGVPGTYSIAENSVNGTVVGQVSASDPNAGDILTYSITGGTGVGVFAINSTTGEITVTNSAALNYESTTSYTLTILVADNGTPGLSDTETITINVLDIPENTNPSIPATGPFTVAENAAVNTVVGTVTGTDPEGHTLTYTITGGNAAGVFAINATTGQIRIASTANLNYELTSSYTLTITATDNGFGTLTGSRNVVINVTNVNEAPIFDPVAGLLATNSGLSYNAATGNFYRFVSTGANYAAAQAAAGAALLSGTAGHLATITTVAENTFVRGLINASAWIGGTDTGVEGQWVWGAGGVEAGQMFWLGGAAGSVQNGLYANWNPGNPDDSGGNEDGLQLLTSGLWNDGNVGSSLGYVIEWEGALILPALQNGPYVINENTAAGTSAGFVHSLDPDVGDTRTYNITGGSGSGVFAVNAATGEITLTGALNYEAASSYTLNMLVQDVGGLTDTVTVTINVGDVNETPILNAAGPFIFNENVAAGTVVTTMSSSDPDTGQTLTYSIQGGNTGNMFAIHATTGALTFNGSPNYEAFNNYNLVIRVTDNGTGALFAQRTVNITINDLNEAPTFDAVQQVLISNPNVVYSATTGNFYQYVASSVNLATARANSMAAMLNGQAGHLVTITSLAENNFVRSLGSASIWLDGSDAAVEGEWTWMSGGAESGQMFWLGGVAGSAQNGLFTRWGGGEPNNSGNEDGVQMLASGFWNDINTGGSYQYVIEWEGAAVMASLQNGPYSVNENSAVGTSIGFVHSADPDAGDTRTYSIIGGSGVGTFSLNSLTGEITLTGPLNYEAASSYTLDLRVQDAAGLFDLVTVTININDLNEVPVLAPAGPLSFNENVAIGTSVTTMAGTDQDGGQTLTYSIQSGNTGGMFAINSSTGEITFAGSPDFETLNSYSLVIRVTDDGLGNLYAEQTLNIGINDLNEVPLLSPAGPFTFNENVAPGAAIVTMIGTDQDGGQILTYTIQSGNTGGMFAINALTGALSFAGSPNYEVLNAYSLVIRVTDNGLGTLFAEQTVAITINDINDVPDVLALSYNRITENEPTGTFIGFLSTIDQDPADTHTYSLITNPGAKFMIVGNELRSNGDIDYELNQNFSIVIRTDDGNGGTLDQSFMILVNDLQDTFAPPPATPTPSTGSTMPAPQVSEVKAVSLIRASLQGGEAGQMLAFYGMGDFHQIIRENVVFEALSLLTRPLNDDFELSEMMHFADSNDAIEENEVADDQLDRFTNLRQALQFHEQMKAAEQMGEQAENEEQVSEKTEEVVRDPPNTIDRQFVDVLTYHEQRQARLREALKG